jgi:hypothetical protein
MEFSVRRSSPPNTYSYVLEENLGSTRKIRSNLLIVFIYYKPNSCNIHAELEWAGGTFLRQQKKFIQPTCSGCICSSICHSVCKG